VIQITAGPYLIVVELLVKLSRTGAADGDDEGDEVSKTKYRRRDLI